MGKRKIRVGILGGAFDPITNAHIQITEYVLKNSSFDEIWLMPSYKNTNKVMISTDHRISMCRKACKNLENISVQTYEIDQELEGGTVNIIKRLREDNKHALDIGYEIAMIIGIDQANNIESWVDYDQLKKSIPFIVIPRKGYRKKPSIVWFTKKPHIYLNKNINLPKISSTEIRFAARHLYTKLPTESYLKILKDNLNPNVLEYIKDNHLYE